MPAGGRQQAAGDAAPLAVPLIQERPIRQLATSYRILKFHTGCRSSTKPANLLCLDTAWPGSRLTHLCMINHVGHDVLVDTGKKPDLLKLTRVSLLSGEQIAVAEGLTVVVGPNNAGKSRLLQEIAERLTLVQLEPHIRPKVTAGIEVERRCEEEALIDWMRGRYKFYAPGSYPHGIYEEESFTSLGGPGVAVREIKKRSWTSGQSSFGKLANFLLRHIPAGQAQSAVATSSSFNALQEAPTQPLQFLYANRDLERLASEEMRSHSASTLPSIDMAVVRLLCTLELWPQRKAPPQPHPSILKKSNHFLFFKIKVTALSHSWEWF